MGVIIDVSEHQAVLNWEAIKGQIDGAIIRCGRGNDTPDQDDDYWARNLAECRRLKIPIESYIYSYAYTADMARSEARHAKRLLAGSGIKRIWYDLEEYRYGTYARTCLSAFAAEMKKDGYEVGLYTGEDFFNAYLRGTTGYPLWIAKYSSFKPNISQEYVAWQFTNGYRLNGVPGGVDASHWYGDFASKSASSYKPVKPKKPKLKIGIKTLNHGIIADKTSKAGCLNDAIVGIKLGVDIGSIEYRVHTLKGRWLSKITGNSWDDYYNGYAGNDKDPIDAIQIYYYTDISKTGGRYYSAQYSVKGAIKGGYYGTILDTNWEGTDGMHTAGKFGDPIVEIKATLA